MTPSISIPVRFGSASGELSWQVETSSFGARLGFAPSSRSDRSIGFDDALVVGGAPGRFITIDALVNHLWLLGLVPDRESVDAICEFRDRVSRTFGDVELAGLTTASGRHLLIVRPDGRTVPISPPLDHRSHRFGWGRDGPTDADGEAGGPAGELSAVDESTMNTARALIGSSRGPIWGPTEELAAQTLAHNHLSRCGPRFSFAANSLCDWFLFDQEPTPGLTAAALLSLSLRPVDSTAMSLPEERGALSTDAISRHAC